MKGRSGTIAHAVTLDPQIEARLGIANGVTFDVNKVPEVGNARANLALAQSEFARIEKLPNEP